MDNNSFENYPGEKTNTEPSEADLARADKWQSAMNSEDVPPFAGDISFIDGATSPETGVRTSPETPGLDTAPGLGETPGLDTAESLAESPDQDNKGLSDAAAIVNYGLNAAAKEYGVETVVQKIKDFNMSGSSNPIKDLFMHLGVQIPAGLDDVKLERAAAKAEEADFYNNSEAAPASKNRSNAGAMQAILDMKELISEVEGADPRYEELREGAKASGKGYFEYAVGSDVNKGLTDLFNTLSEQSKKAEE